MPPKSDPYATPRARAADLVLILLALLAILLAIWTAPKTKANPDHGGMQQAQAIIEVTG
jgi:hypothetical protein